MTERRPELGKLKPGQDVIVVRSPNDWRRRKPEDCRIPTKVLKVGRAWVELGDLDAPRWSVNRWRMRLDSQDEGSDYSGSNARFVTLEQNVWEQTQNWALGVLQDNGVDLRRGSPWEGREVELAEMIVTRQKEEG